MEQPVIAAKQPAVLELEAGTHHCVPVRALEEATVL